MDLPQESKVKILICCPQCGGDIGFLEESQAIHCEFCGSSLLVAGREGVLRYVLPAQVTDPQAAQALALDYLRGQGKRSPRSGKTFLFHAPFWRIRGTVYRWVFGLKPMKVEIEAGVPPPMERIKVLLTRLMDHTVAGYTGLELGLSTIGVRAQTLRLEPFSREHLEKRSSFLPLDVSLEQVQAEVERFDNFFFEAESLAAEVILHRLVGRAFSVIYFPLWYVECQYAGGQDVLLIDAAGEKILRSVPDGSSILAKLKGEESRKSFEFSELHFLSLRCPNCGWAFSFRPLSVLHFCPTCRRLWRVMGTELAEVGYRVILPAQRSSVEGLLWVPFWRCRTVMESAGDKLETMADLYRLAPPPRVVNPEQEARKPIYFYIPAVKFRSPQVIHNLGSRLTFVQPEIKPEPFPDGSHPETAGGSLLDKDAREMGLMILGSMIPQGSRKARVWLKGCRVELAEPEVLYFPFAQADLFYKELSTGLSFQRNALPEDLPGNGG